MKTRTTGKRITRKPKSLFLLTIIAIAPSLNAHAGGSNSKSLPDSVQSINMTNSGNEGLSHLLARRECENSHKGANACKDIPSQDVVFQCNAYMNPNIKELKLKGSVEELAAITNQLRHCLTTSGSCHWTKVDLSGITQRHFVSYREKSGLAEFLTLLQEKCSKSLTHINLEGLTLKQEDLKAIDGMSGLEYLNLRRTNLTGAEFKAAIGGRNTKLAKLQTLLVSPTKSGKMLPDLQYPRDFGFLPSITFFDGRVTGPMGSKQQLSAQGVQLLAGKDPFSEDPTYFDDTWEHNARFGHYKKALKNIGRKILKLSQFGGVAEAEQILKDNPEEAVGFADENPNSSDYFAMGNHFKVHGHPEIAHYFFEEAKDLANTELQKAKSDNRNASVLSTLEGKSKARAKAYYDSLFRYNRNLYKYREELGGKSKQENRMSTVEKKMAEARDNGIADAKTWLDEYGKQNVDKELNFNYEFGQDEDKGTDAVISYVKRHFISNNYGCPFEKADLSGLTNPRFQYSRKLKLADLLSLLRKECKGLRELTLGSTRLTDRDVKEISQMDQLSTLTLLDSSLSSSQLKTIGQMDLLKKLEVKYFTPGNNISPSNLQKYILPMRGLTELDVTGAYRKEIPQTVFEQFGFKKKSEHSANQIFEKELKRQ